MKKGSGVFVVLFEELVLPFSRQTPNNLSVWCCWDVVLYIYFRVYANGFL